MKKGFHTMKVIWRDAYCEYHEVSIKFSSDEFQIRALAALAEIRNNPDFLDFVSFDISQPKKR